MKRLLTLALALLFCLTACQKAPEITITTPATIEMSSDGSNGTITFTANRDWTAKASESWVHISQTSGEASKGQVTITVRCDANTTYDDRTATVTISAEDVMQMVTIKQPQNIGIVLSTQTFNIEADTKSIEVEVQANTEYTVLVRATWIKQAGTKALTSKTLLFNIEENETYDDRTATIAITPQNSAAQSQVIRVTQAAKTEPEAIDLGLSVKWANMNVGAKKPEDYGGFYAWGETKSKNNYDFSTYKWCNGERTGITKYYPFNDLYMWGGQGNPDMKSQLDLEDDVAHVQLGKGWRMPTSAEWTELLRNSTWSRNNQNGIKGHLITSRINGKSIFLPSGGEKHNIGATSNVGEGCYWSSTLSSSDPSAARKVRLTDTEVLSPGAWAVRSAGLSVRPVTE